MYILTDFFGHASKGTTFSPPKNDMSSSADVTSKSSTQELDYPNDLNFKDPNDLNFKDISAFAMNDNQFEVSDSDFISPGIYLSIC